MRSEGHCKRNKKSSSKLMKIICLPIRLLRKARDFYMNSLEDCAGRVGYGGGVVCHTHPSAAASSLPRSFSSNNSFKSNDDEEFGQLLRTASKRGATHSKVQPDMKIQQQREQRKSRMKVQTTMGMRSYSVGIGKMGRIDEDKPCSFEEDEMEAMARSRSHAVRKNLIVYR